jgi:hypothetical protein
VVFVYPTRNFFLFEKVIHIFFRTVHILLGREGILTWKMHSRLFIRLYKINYSFMNSITKYVSNLGRATRTIILALAVIVGSAAVAQAATTITTDISTANLTTTAALVVGTTAAVGTSATVGSTLSVTGLASFLGGATTTSLTLLSGDKITNAVASTTKISGNLTVGDGTAVTPALIVTNTANATSSISVGCIQATATSSATKVKIVFSALGATSTFAGTAYWSYGTCP